MEFVNSSLIVNVYLAVSPAIRVVRDWCSQRQQRRLGRCRRKKRTSSVIC